MLPSASDRVRYDGKTAPPRSWAAGATLSEPEKQLAAFDAWCAREIWVKLAEPTGLPGQDFSAATDPIDLSSWTEEGGALTCPIDGTRFECRASLAAHTEENFPGGQFSRKIPGGTKCSVCNKGFDSLAELGLHQDLKHPSCAFCNRYHTLVLHPSATS